MKESVLQRIKEVLELKSNSETQFAKLIGVNQKTINQQFRGERALSLDTVLAVASAFEDISMEWLIRGEGEMIKEAEKKSEDNKITQCYKVSEINTYLGNAYSRMLKSAATDDGISGIHSGFDKLDKLLSGFNNGDLIVIGSRPSMGKTSFIISMIKNMIIGHNVPILFFSLEMSDYRITNKLISNFCDIPVEKIESGRMIAEEWEQLDHKLKQIVDAPLYMDASASITIEELCKKAKYAVEHNNIQIVIIDYLQLLYNEVKYTDNRYLELNYFTRRLKSLAKELNVPIIVLSQLNRDAENRTGEYGKYPQLSDLRDSGTICDDADLILFLYRPEYYHYYVDINGNDLRGTAKLIIAKNRYGCIGEVDLKYNSNIGSFSNLDLE